MGMRVRIAAFLASLRKISREGMQVGAKQQNRAEDFVARQAETLRGLLGAHREEVARLDGELEELLNGGEGVDVQFDEESGEGDPVTVERDRLVALRRQALDGIAGVEAALTRVERGRYGMCEQCGEPIAAERLEALPTTTSCIACKTGGLLRRRRAI